MERGEFEKMVNRLLADRGTFSSTEAAAAAGVTRQAAHRRLRQMVADGALAATGEARARRYGPRRDARPGRQEWRLDVAGLQEHEAWDQVQKESSALRRVGANALNILNYAFTEIVNNAIEHSSSYRVDIATERVAEGVRIEVRDEGVGIFDQIRTAYGLNSQLDALAELQKGKVTTRPDRHTGEGIFFVSKAVDFFEIDSGGLRWQVDNIRGDVAVGQGSRLMRGTFVRFDVAPEKSVTLQEVFGQYTTEFEFDKTRALVRLFDHGSAFISRSEAKRLTAGLERFREVILDFDRVETVGQGFADEVFRVWQSQHPQIEIRPVNMNPGVVFMVRRAGSERTGAG